MELYINSAGIISAAGNNIGEGYLSTHDYNTTALYSADADYKAYIPVMQLRRMSKAVRMGVVASKVAMQKAGVAKPDAITVGTAYGCLQDTERFLDKMVNQDEQMLTPTAFIQSTHNTVSGQIALLSKCNGHNLTFVHKGHSFEHALIDAQMYLEDNNSGGVLVGGIDELTENSINALQLGGVGTNESLSTENVIRGGNKGAVIGEGAAFFYITKQPVADKYIKINALNIFKSTDESKAVDRIKSFVNALTDIDTVLLGDNGGNSSSLLYNKLVESAFPNIATAKFKHLCGEFPTASSFALGMLSQYVEIGEMPIELNAPAKHIVLINNFKQYYSCWGLELSV